MMMMARTSRPKGAQHLSIRGPSPFGEECAGAHPNGRVEGGSQKSRL